MLKRILMLLIMAVPLQTFAADVSGGETCDTNVLNTDTGPVNLRAEFEPEVINLKWYNGDTRVNVPTASNTCTYDTAISLPPNPTKPGYKFKGWKVVWDFSTLDKTIDGTDSGYGTDGGWYVTFPYGQIIGTTLCSVSSAPWGQTGTPDETTSGGTSCWCKATGFIKDGVTYKPALSLPWVFHYTAASVSDCLTGCAACHSNIKSYVNFRGSILGQ